MIVIVACWGGCGGGGRGVGERRSSNRCLIPAESRSRRENTSRDSLMPLRPGDELSFSATRIRATTDEKRGNTRHAGEIRRCGRELSPVSSTRSLLPSLLDSLPAHPPTNSSLPPLTTLPPTPPKDPSVILLRSFLVANATTAAAVEAGYKRWKSHPCTTAISSLSYFRERSPQKRE